MDFHYLRFRTFVHATEDPQVVRRVLRTVAAVDEDHPLEEVEAEGHHKNPIRILEVELERDRDIRRALERLAEHPGNVDTLLHDLDHRVDEDCNLYLRLDKQAAARGRVQLATSDDVVHVRGKVAAFPAKPETARAKVRETLQDLRSAGGAGR